MESIPDDIEQDPEQVTSLLKGKLGKTDNH